MYSLRSVIRTLSPCYRISVGDDDRANRVSLFRSTCGPFSGSPSRSLCNYSMLRCPRTLFFPYRIPATFLTLFYSCNNSYDFSFLAFVISLKKNTPRSRFSYFFIHFRKSITLFVLFKFIFRFLFLSHSWRDGNFENCRARHRSDQLQLRVVKFWFKGIQILMRID